MFDRKITINGAVVEYDYNGATAGIKIAKNEPVSMEQHINNLHTLDRTHYDTPNSVRGCACSSCNGARKSRGIRGIGWQKPDIDLFGVIERIGMTQSDACSTIGQAYRDEKLSMYVDDNSAIELTAI